MHFNLITFCILSFIIVVTPKNFGNNKQIKLLSNQHATTTLKATTTSLKPKLDLQNFLTKYGYAQFIPELNSVLSSSFDDSQLLKNEFVKKAIRLFQRMFNLPETGELDAETEKKMQSPQCSVSHFRVNGKFSNFKTVSKWLKTDLTWKILNFTNDLPQANIRKAMTLAFSYWSEVSQLKFKEVCKTCASDIQISFERLDHDDGEPFDGKGNNLAHAAFPDDGRIHFDDDEQFTEDNPNGIDLRIVATHEIGHVLGIDHSFVAGALMNPFYRYIQGDLLHKDDVLAIQSLYGKPLKTAATTATTTTTIKSTTTTGKSKIPNSITEITKSTAKPTTTTSNRPTTTTATLSTKSFGNNFIAACANDYNAVFEGPNKTIDVIINGDDLWEFSLRTRSWRRRILTDVLPGIMDNVRGGVRDRRGILWFFRGRRVWAYNKFKLVDGYPKFVEDPLYAPHPLAAINKNNTVYLIKGHIAYKFSTSRLKVELPESKESVFPGITGEIEAAIKFRGQHYLFDDQMVYKFNEETNSVQENYPKMKHEAWFPCFNHDSYNKGPHGNLIEADHFNPDENEEIQPPSSSRATTKVSVTPPKTTTTPTTTTTSRKKRKIILDFFKKVLDLDE